MDAPLPAVKLHSQPTAGTNVLTAYGDGFLEVNRVRHAGSILVPAQGEVRPWGPQSWDGVDAASIAEALADGPEVLLLGGGARQRFPAGALLAALVQARVGFEAMDTAAAARTFNILAMEGRKVLAALLPLASPSRSNP